MSTNDVFIKDFGRRCLEQIQKLTKDVAVIKEVQFKLVQNVNEVFGSEIVLSLIEQAKDTVAERKVEELRMEIRDKQKRLCDIEMELTAKRTRRTTQERTNTTNIQTPTNVNMLDDEDDYIYSQIVEEQSTVSNETPQGRNISILDEDGVNQPM